MVREYAESAVTVVLVAVVVALVVGQALGQPVLLGYVTTDSMSGTIDPGDGFVAIPSQLTGPPDVGDVVTYRAVRLHDGGLTTHRVVGTTDGGYVTKGDANPFTDQDGAEPPVPRDRIVAEALQVNGHVVVIPDLGTGVMAVKGGVVDGQRWLANALGLRAGLSSQGAGFLLFAFGLVLFVLSVLDDLRAGDDRDRSRSRARDVLDGRWVALAFLVIVLAPANLAMVGGSTTHHVQASGDAVAASGATPGEPVESTFDVRNNGVVSMLVVVDSRSQTASVDRRALALPPGERATATLSMPAPPRGETSTATVSEHRYFLLLPESTLLALHDADPRYAWAVINLLLACSVLGLVGGVVGFAPTRVRDTSRDVPLRTRLRRLVRP
ncbi:S26 family signal peptidase [Halocalculus aciditolerans]|uniref:Signal peptidase I n=1 Tax=Halocalculus aciditolerans TaxID=1383812 RepID=A0A830F3A0_9EURY|nr:S26 family signal peptidase [Halocalculus aciditolerans]GGL58610.1 signal peptidase I [Halocalculus aciditolerans]